MMRRHYHFQLLATSALVACLAAGPASTAVIRVSPEIGSIQSAVDAAAPGDTVYVPAGEYYESIIISQSGLHLLGAGADVTSIFPEPGGPEVPSRSTCLPAMVEIHAHGVTVEGLFLDGGGTEGIGIGSEYGMSSIRVTDVVVRSLYHAGICLAGGVNNLVSDCTVWDVAGIPFQSCGVRICGGAGVTVEHSLSSFCEIGIAYLSGASGHAHHNAVDQSTIGMLVSGNGGEVEFGPANDVSDYYSAGIEASQAGAAVSIHHNLIATSEGPGPGGSGGIGVFGQNISWTGTHEILGNILSGPASANSYGIWIDTFAGSTSDVHARLRDNTVHFFEIGVYLVDSNGDPSALHDVVIGGGDALDANRLGFNVDYAVMLEGCDDNITATMNDWGVYTPGGIELDVHHKVDDPLLGMVFFMPALTAPIAVEPITWGEMKREFAEP
jgi:hypothetical protein